METRAAKRQRCDDIMTRVLEIVQKEECSIPSNMEALFRGVPDDGRFSLSPLDSDSSNFQEVASAFASTAFKVLSILSVKNSFSEAFFDTYGKVSPSGSTNIQSLYHCTFGDLIEILEHGLQPFNFGYFGHAVYFSPSVLKAANYDQGGFSETKLRVMLRCRVNLGNVKEYMLGRSEPKNRLAPNGFDSVAGYLRTSKEYAVYSGNQVLITELIFYRSTNTERERELARSHDFKSDRPVVMITLPLSVFLNQLTDIARSKNVEKEMGGYIRSLLTRAIDGKEFLSQTERLLNSKCPADCLEKLNQALDKSAL